MRKIVLYELLSVDGVAEGPDNFVLDFDEVMRENLRRVIADQDAVILGRRTYEEWAVYWPGNDNEPFASFINGVRKYVVTSTEPGRLWANTTVVHDPLDDFLMDLKSQPGGDIGVHASVTLAQSLLERGLVDELRLVIAPALAATGRKLFVNPARHRLELTRNVASPAGYLLVDFRVGKP